MDRLAWTAAREAVDAVRYQPSHLKLLVACGVSQPETPPGVAQWMADARAEPAVRALGRLPHAVVRTVAAWAARVFGPTASAAIRFLSGAAAGAADRLGAGPLERRLGARAHPGLLVPHPHAVAVLAADMRGFSHLTATLEDTQYLAELIEQYLSTLTRVVERHRGVVFQYTGDGLLALFLPELAGASSAAMFDRLVHELCPELHAEFDALRTRWEAEWRAQGRPLIAVGLGLGLSFGEVTIGFLGASGKKQFGAIGVPVNHAAFLCAVAYAGTVLVDRPSFVRAGCEPLEPKIVRLRSRKLGRRIEAVSIRATPGRVAIPLTDALP